MTAHEYLLDRNARQQISERVETTRRSGVPGRRRPRAGRHALASGLHRLADRLDG